MFIWFSPWNLKLQQPQLPRAEPDEQPNESSQLAHATEKRGTTRLQARPPLDSARQVPAERVHELSALKPLIVKNSARARSSRYRNSSFQRRLRAVCGLSGTRFSLSAMRPSSAIEVAFILCIKLLRWTFTVVSLMPRSPAICLLRRPCAT